MTIDQFMEFMILGNPLPSNMDQTQINASVELYRQDMGAASYDAFKQMIVDANTASSVAFEDLDVRAFVTVGLSRRWEVYDDQGALINSLEDANYTP